MFWICSVPNSVWQSIVNYTLFVFTWALVSFNNFCCVHYVTTNYISSWSPSNIRIVKLKSASIQLQTRKIWPPKNFPIHFRWGIFSGMETEWKLWLWLILIVFMNSFIVFIGNTLYYPAPQHISLLALLFCLHTVAAGQACRCMHEFCNTYISQPCMLTLAS